MAQGTDLESFKIQTLGGTYGNPPPVLIRDKGTYQGECASYTRQYLEAVYGITTVSYGNAVDWFNNPKLHVYFTQVTDGSRKDGDILCWADDPGSMTGKYGHVAISYQGKILNQNYNASKKVTINNFFSAGYQGALRFKGETEMPITNTDNEFSRWSKTFLFVRGRYPSRAEFEKYAVGQTWLQTLETLEDDPEATNAQHWQDTGYRAVTENWEQNIIHLEESNKTLTKENEALKEQVSDGQYVPAGELFIKVK